MNRLLIKPHTHLAFFHNYLNDLLLIPCALPVVLLIQRALRLRPAWPPPSFREILFHLAVWSVVCEWVGPRLFANSRGDPYDVVAYSIGAIGAWAWWNRNKLPVYKPAHEL